MRNFRELEIWKSSMSLTTDIYKLTRIFPSEEKYALAKQINRATVSIPSNIAEGSAKRSNKDFVRFLQISLGSAFEVETQLQLASNLGYLTDPQVKPVMTNLTTIQKRINAMITAVSNFKSR